MRLSYENFRRIGMTMVQNVQSASDEQGGYTNDDERAFRAIFGVHWGVAAEVWYLLDDHYPDIHRQPKHLFWALIFLKQYGNEQSHCMMIGGGASLKTFRKWVWKVLEGMADLSAVVIVWEDRKSGDIGNDCLVSVDCTDVQIREPFPYSKIWSPRWFSPKFKGPGLRYEICVSIIGGDVVWVNGPFACGTYSDYKIFTQEGLLSNLDEGERVECDDGYGGADPEFAKTRSGIFHPTLSESVRNCVRARQETVNKRFKQFQALCQPFRHNLDKHAAVFNSVAVLTQLSIQNGEPLFQVDGYDDRLFYV